MESMFQAIDETVRKKDEFINNSSEEIGEIDKELIQTVVCGAQHNRIAVIITFTYFQKNK